MTLTDFLLARIAEDEAWARSCEGLHWQWVGDVTDHPVVPDPMLDENLYGVDDENVSLRSVEEFPYNSIAGKGPRFFVSTDEVLTVAAGHIARHDPARVLAECEAKRRIVERLRLVERENRRSSKDFARWAAGKSVPEEPPTRATQASETDGLRIAVAALALPYADHPDYRDEWRP